MRKFIIEVDKKEVEKWQEYMVSEGYCDPDTEIADMIRMSIGVSELDGATVKEITNESPGMVATPGRDSMAVL